MISLKNTSHGQVWRNSHGNGLSLWRWTNPENQISKKNFPEFLNTFFWKNFLNFSFFSDSNFISPDDSQRIKVFSSLSNSIHKKASGRKFLLFGEPDRSEYRNLRKTSKTTVLKGKLSSKFSDSQKKNCFLNLPLLS